MVHYTHTRRKSEKSSDFHEILYTAADFELIIGRIIAFFKGSSLYGFVSSVVQVNGLFEES